MVAQPILTLSFDPPLAVIKRDLDKLGVDIRSFREPLKRSIQKVIIPSIQKNFDAGGRPAWAPYADSTIEFHEMLNEDLSSSMLVKSGALKATMSFLSNWTISTTSATLTDLPQRVWYGKVHQAGGKGGKAGHTGVIPARPFVMFQDEDGTAITEVFAQWLDERIMKNWGRK
jgi:phage virion morphogenesis protein